MLQNEPRKFGGPISKADSERLYRNFIKLKIRTHETIKKLLTDSGDAEALRYYCGQHG